MFLKKNNRKNKYLIFFWKKKSFNFKFFYIIFEVRIELLLEKYSKNMFLYRNLYNFFQYSTINLYFI